MPEWLMAIVIGSVVLGLIGLVWRAQEQRINDLETWKRDKEKFDYDFRHDQYAPAISAINNQLLPLVGRVDDLRHYNDHTLQKILSDVYGTISTSDAELERRIERIENFLNGKLKGDR